MNILKKDNNIYYLESYFSSDNNIKKDSNNKVFPIPKNKNKIWSDKDNFINKLKNLENKIKKNKFHKFKNINNCFLCNKFDNKEDGYYLLDNIIWKSSLIHYIKYHNIKPTNKFIKFIYNYELPFKKEIIKINGVFYKKYGLKYITLSKDQILILDALMEHGSKKKYGNKNNKYSEHAGLIDFNEKGVDKLIISGKTTRIDKDDEEIFLPNLDNEYDYEYIFHTHPSTPYPGYRVKLGILYECPSISDISHFYYHNKIGKTQGSIVIAPEGLYIIRRLDNNKNIILDRNILKEINKEHDILQMHSIDIHGEKFNINFFYDNIITDRTFINSYNKILNKYNIQIDYYQRIKDRNGNMYIESINLPVEIYENI